VKDLRFILNSVTLDHAPDGWDEAMIVTERSKKYHGIFRSFTIPMKFVKDGAELVRDEFYTHGLAASVTMEVQKLDRDTLTYSTAFTGTLDFNTFKDHDYDIEITAADGSLAQIVKSRESDEVEFDYTAYSSSLTVSSALDTTVNPGGTVIRCMSLFQVFGAIMNGITGGGITAGTYGIKSDFLSTSGGGIWHKYYLTTISSIKYGSNDILFLWKTSLQDFFKSIDAIWCLGMGIEVIGGKETIRIEKRDYFYSNGAPSVIADVGKSKNLSCGLLSDFIFNKVKIGYPVVSYSDDGTGGSGANSLEPNTETQYKIPAVIGKEYEAISKYRADYQGIKALFGTEVEDTKDNDPFFLSLKHTSSPDGWYLVNGKLQKKSNPGVDVENPGNMDISPRRMLTNHQFFLNGCCYGLGNLNIEFLSGTNDQANNDTAISSGGTVQGEYESLLIRDSFTWFRPVEFNIEAAYDRDFQAAINANPYGVVRFIYDGTTYTGYILKMEVKLSGRGSVKYSLLSTDTNDLTRLIR